MTINQLPPGWLTEKEFADKWGKSQRTIQRWRELGKGPKFKEMPGGQKIIHDDDADGWAHNLPEVG